MKVPTFSDQNGETYVNIEDLIALFEDIKKNPKNYKKKAVINLIGQLAGKIPLKPEIERPF